MIIQGWFPFSSVQSLSHVWLFATPWTASCPSPTPKVYSNSCPLSQWNHPAISYSVLPFSSCLQSFPASGSFQMSQFFLKEITKVNPKGNHSWIIIGRTDAETETPIVRPHLTHLKRHWCWERLRAEGEGEDRGWDGWMASPPQWTRLSANSRR